MVFLLIALVLAGAVAVTALDWDKAPPPEHGGETKDRRRDPEIDRLLEPPLNAAKAHRWPSAGRGFETALATVRARRGRDSLQAADTLSAFGVGLHEQDQDTRALPYLTRAIAAYRAAVGPDSPEVAVALHDYANIALDVAPDRASPELVAAIRECLRIREKALGPRNAETAVTYVLLGRVTGFADYTMGDPKKVEAAADLVRRGITLLPLAPNADPGDISSARYRLAEVYAHNARGAEVVQMAGGLDRSDDGFNPGQIVKLAAALEASGDAETARDLRARFAPQPAAADAPDQ